MQVGEVNAAGWVERRVLPSTLTEAEVTAVEKEFGVQFPPLFRAYWLPLAQPLYGSCREFLVDVFGRC
jgi:hypothetical protein